MWEVFYLYIKRDHIWNLRPMDRVWELWHNVWSIFHHSINIIYIYVYIQYLLYYTQSKKKYSFMSSVSWNQFNQSLQFSLCFGTSVHPFRLPLISFPGNHRRPCKGDSSISGFGGIISRETVNQRNRNGSFLMISNFFIYTAWNNERTLNIFGLPECIG